MHTVAFFQGFARDAADAGMTDDEVDDLVNYLSENPTAGVEIPGTGGCRKLRFAKQGKGKRGGYRMVTFYSGKQLPVFLVTVFSEGEKSDLSKSECNELRVMTKVLVNEYKRKVATLATKKGA